MVLLYTPMFIKSSLLIALLRKQKEAIAVILLRDDGSLGARKMQSAGIPQCSGVGGGLGKRRRMEPSRMIP